MYVEVWNIIVVWGIQFFVYFVDFGFVWCSSNRNLQKVEFRKLYCVLEKMMRVGVGKELDGVKYFYKWFCLVQFNYFFKVILMRKRDLLLFVDGNVNL